MAVELADVCQGTMVLPVTKQCPVVQPISARDMGGSMTLQRSANAMLDGQETAVLSLAPLSTASFAADMALVISSVNVSAQVLEKPDSTVVLAVIAVPAGLVEKRVKCCAVPRIPSQIQKTSCTATVFQMLEVSTARCIAQ